MGGTKTKRARRPSLARLALNKQRREMKNPAEWRGFVLPKQALQESNSGKFYEMFRPRLFA